MRIIAHRSGPTVYPEQTIASAKLAMQENADMIEIDVRFTKDKKIAITHDDNLKRVFGVDKNVSEMTGEEFLALRHTGAKEYPSHLLEDYLECGVEKLLIHIKEPDIIDDLLKCLDEHDYLDKVVLGVQEVKTVDTIKKYNDNIKILAFMPGEHIKEFAEAGVDYIRLWEGWLNDENVALVRSLGKELWVMTGCHNGFDVGYTSKEGLEKILAYKVDGILVNDVNFLKENM